MELVGKLGFEPVDAGPVKNTPAGATRYGVDRPSDEARPRARLRLRAGKHEMMLGGPRIARLVYAWRGGCGLWAGSVSYLKIFAIMEPPTRGFSSASSASALAFS
jgi:hypothetical protein